MARLLCATITVTLTVNFEEPPAGTSWQDAAIKAMEESFSRDHEGTIGTVIEPSVDSIEVVQEN